jgi:osmotically-inducible protein OsmY
MTTRPPADRVIHQAVLDALRDDAVVDETDVGVEVDDGIVTLTGTVSTWTRRAAAARAAHRAPGVRDVANDIEVRLPGVVGRSDTDVAAAVRAAIDAQPELAGADVTTTVVGGVVTLDGAVRTGAQRDVLDGCLRALSVVRGVVNRVAVRS